MTFVKKLGIGLLTISLVGASVPAHATGRGRSAAGTYGFTITEHCVETPRIPAAPPGFDESKRLLIGANAVTAVLTGKMRLGTRGDLSLFETTISDLFIDRTLVGDVPIATGVGVMCDGSYDVSDGSALDANFSCRAELPGGIRVEIGPFSFVGFVGPLSGVMTSLEGNIQTEALYINGNQVAGRQRACLLTGSFVRI